MFLCFTCGLDQQCCIDRNPLFLKVVATLPVDPVDTYFNRTEILRLFYYEEILQGLPLEILREAEPSHPQFKLRLNYVKSLRGIL